jgi:hypothetical protein
MTKYYRLKSNSANEKPIPGEWDEFIPAIEGPFADATWPYTLRQNIVGNTSYNTFTRGYAIVSKGAFLCTKMQIIFGQKNGADTMRLGIYNNLYNLVASTPSFLLSSISGDIADVALSTPYQVQAKMMYYLAFSISTSAPGNTKWPVIQDADTLTTQPLTQVSDAANAMPNSIGIGSIVNAYRVWMGWSA